MSFNARQKRIAVAREIKWRRHVYGSRVTRGLMSQAEADYELSIMMSIEADYRRAEEEEAPSLFRAPVPP